MKPVTRRSFRIPDDEWLVVEGGQAFVDAMTYQLDPYPGQEVEANAPLMTIHERAGRPSLLELQNLAGDGWVTGYDGERLFTVANGRTCSVPDDDGLMLVEPGFPTRRLMSVVRPTIQLALLRRRTPVLHAASVEIEGRAVLVAGWSESGKTETALALVERGGGFLSDKWALLLPGARAGAFPIGVGVRRWVLRYLPQLRSGLSGGARTQLRAAAIASAATAPLRARSWRGPLGRVADVTRRAVELGDRAALSPKQVRAAYGDERDPMRTPPIGCIAVLRTGVTADVTIEDGDAARLATRLAESAAIEREPFIALQRRAAYAEGRSAAIDELVARDAVAIEAVLGSVQLIEVTAPFPTDPREVAQAIAARL